MTAKKGRAHRRRVAGSEAKSGGAATVFRSRRLWLLLVAAAFIAVVVSYSVISGGGEAGFGGKPALASEAPDITLPTSEGTFHLAEHKGDVVVLYFARPG